MVIYTSTLSLRGSLYIAIMLLVVTQLPLSIIFASNECNQTLCANHISLIILDINICDEKSSKFCDWTQDTKQTLMWIKHRGKSDVAEHTGPLGDRLGSETGQVDIDYIELLRKNYSQKRPVFIK